MGIIRAFIKWVKGPAKKPINVDRVQTPYVRKKREDVPMAIKRPVGRPKGSKGIKKRLAAYKQEESQEASYLALWGVDDYYPTKSNEPETPTTVMGGGQFGGAGAASSWDKVSDDSVVTDNSRYSEPTTNYQSDNNESYSNTSSNDSYDSASSDSGGGDSGGGDSGGGGDD